MNKSLPAQYEKEKIPTIKKVRKVKKVKKVKRVKRFLALVFMMVLGAGSLAIAYYWSQLTALPKEYQAKNSSPKTRVLYFKDTEPELKVADKIQLQVKEQLEEVTEENQLPESVEVELEQQELNQLLINNIAEKTKSQDILAGATIVNPKIAEDEIEIGAVFNTSDLSFDHLKAHEQNFVERAIATFPGFRERDVYIGIEGKLKAENGGLRFDEETKIKLGNVKLTVGEVAEILGVPAEKIIRRLDLEMNQLNIDEVELGGEGVKLKVSVN